MKAKIVSKEVSVTTSKTFNEVQLTLSADEALFLKGLVGHICVGDSAGLRGCADRIYYKLDVVVPTPEFDFDYQSVAFPREVPDNFKKQAAALKDERTFP